MSRKGNPEDVHSPLNFLSRLCSLIPRPKIHLTRFHGGLASHFKYRSLLTPKPSSSKKPSSHEKDKKNTRSYSIGWAKRLKKVLGIDIQTCSKCGGKVKIISAIKEVQFIQRILNYRGESCSIPKLSPPREPPETNENFISL